MSSTPSSASTDKLDSAGKALGRVASGVYIVTLKQGEDCHGLLATWLSQASFKPPMITMAVNKERPMMEELKPGAKFTVNIISKNNMDIFKAFAKPATSSEERFADIKVENRITDGPIFPEAVAYLDCTVVSSLDAGDHVVFLGEIVDGALLNAENEPMTHIRKSGFQY